jgi:hypothetical protein
LLLKRPQIPPLPASSARLAEMAVSPGSGATMVNLEMVYVPKCLPINNIETKVQNDRRGWSLINGDAPSSSFGDPRVIYSSSPQNIPRGQLAKFPRLYPHGGQLSIQLLRGPTGWTRKEENGTIIINQMLVRMAGYPPSEPKHRVFQSGTWSLTAVGPSVAALGR